MLAKELINLLERRGLLDQEIIEALRDQLAQSGARVTPEAVAKLLVDNEHLTRFQATKLIGELRAGEYGGADGDEVAEAVADELDLAEEAGEAVEVVEVVEEEPMLVEAFDDTPEVVEAIPVEEVVEAIPVAEALDSGGASQGTVAAERRRRANPEKNIWDSFKIYGVAGIILMLLIGGFGIWWILNSQDSSGFIKNADSLYDSSSFPAAREEYEKFINRYGSTDPTNASKARVRVATTQIYEAIGGSDPIKPLLEAERVLPAVEDEEAMGEERPALADTLVVIGENIADKAEKARETEEKKTLLAGLDQLVELTRNAKYMSSSLRQNLATRLTMLNEARSRIDRTINRNVRLAESLGIMRTALDAKETKTAYDERKELLRDYPELTDDTYLQELILEASGIQKDLVAVDAKVPDTLRDDVPQREQRSIVLANLVGAGAPGLANRVVYFQVRGSVLAFEADTGKHLWRRFVGYQHSHLPLALGDAPGDGVLLSDGARSEVQRLSGTAGELQWRTQIGEPFSKPQVEGESVYLSTSSGRLLGLDAMTGDAKWVVQLPQTTRVSPGVSDRASRLYQIGDHSNLYVIDAKNGKCVESFYTGHVEDSIRVPPVPLLGHLFVIENIDPKNSRIHILRMNEQGEGLVKAQPSVPLTGNVITPPKVQRRRLVVLTDRGQVKVLDIEPTAEAEQVTVVAEQVASYDQPTATQMEVDRSQMWVTGTRVNRYELQMNTGRIVFSWTKHAGDSFIAPPRLMDGVLYHARVLKGTKGVRVSAVTPATGEMKWQTDVGVPVTMLKPTTGGVHAITAQAALYMLDADAFKQGITGSPIENPGGRDGFTLRFEDPLKLNEEVTVLLNAEDSGQLAVYNPTRNREVLRIVKLGVGLNKATAPPLITAGGVMLALDNGRIVLKDYRTGVDLGSAFQPAAAPEGTVDWYELVPLPSDPEQVIVGDSRGKLYRIRAGDQLRSLTEASNPLKLLGPMAGLGETLFATTSAPSADVLVRFNINNLEEIGRSTLEGRAVWGPLQFDDKILLRTDDGKLRAFDEQAKSLWSVELPVGRPVAKPVVVDGQWLLAGEPGWLLALDPTTGEIRGQVDFGEPLSAAPLPVGRSNRLFVPGSEGVIYITDMPTETQ